nr:hypothetical protein [Candidatus Cloacimonadota bacterium]
MLLAISVLPAQKLNYKVSSMSLKVADLVIDMGPRTIEVRVQNQGRLSIFPHLNNIYCVQMNEMSLPTSYQRIIHQGELRDSVQTIYNHPKAVMYRQSTGQSLKYKISNNSRDFFSFLYTLCENPSPSNSYILDEDGRQWRAYVRAKERQRIHTEVGNIYARCLEIQLEPLNDQEHPYVDMLTHNFFDEDIKVTIWISDNGVPLKAHLKKNFIGMNWEIIGID